MKKKLLFLAIVASMVLTGCQSNQSRLDGENTEEVSGTAESAVTAQNGGSSQAVNGSSGLYDGKGYAISGKDGSKLYDMTDSEIDWRYVREFKLDYAYGWTNDSPTELRKLCGNETVNGYHVSGVFSTYGYAGSYVNNYTYVCNGAHYTLSSLDDPFDGIDIEGIMSCDDDVWSMYIIRKDGDEQFPVLTVNSTGEIYGISTLEVGGEEISVQPFPICLRIVQGEENVLSELDQNERYHAVLNVDSLIIQSKAQQAADCPATKMFAEAYIKSVENINKV